MGLNLLSFLDILTRWPVCHPSAWGAQISPFVMPRVQTPSRAVNTRSQSRPQRWCSGHRTVPVREERVWGWRRRLGENKSERERERIEGDVLVFAISYINKRTHTHTHTHHFKQQPHQLLWLSSVFWGEGGWRHIEEGCLTLSSYSLGQHGLSCPWRPNHQHTLPWPPDALQITDGC